MQFINITKMWNILDFFKALSLHQSFFGPSIQSAALNGNSTINKQA